MIPPNAKNMFAKLIVIKVKNKVFTFLMYLKISKRIAKLIRIITEVKIITFSKEWLVVNKKEKKDIKINNGKNG